MSHRPAVAVSGLALVLAACGGVGSEGAGRTPPAAGTGLDRVAPNPVMPEPTVGGAAGEMPGEDPPAAVGTPRGQVSDEDTGAACPILPLSPFGELAVNEELPDPFLSLDGTRIARQDEWTCRRSEISSQVQEYQLGPKPPKPSSVTGSFAGNAITVTATEGERSVSFDADITLPPTGTAPYPAMIAIGRSSLDNAALAAQGVAIISFPNDEVGVQQNGQSRGLGLFYDLYGNGHRAGAMMAWAWGVSRLIDALETTPEASIDPDRLGVTGCSRNGKGALVVGAFDERIALTIPQESGAGGSSLWRMADVNHAAWLAAGSPPGQDVQTLSQIVQENVWFSPSFSQFSSAATRLPFDQHMVMAMVAPRALFVVNNTSMYWLDREGSHVGASVAHYVWEALGVPDAMGASQVGNHDHCEDVPAAQTAEIGAYVQKFLIGDGTGNTDVMYSDGGYTVDRERWVGWETPALEAAPE